MISSVFCKTPKETRDLGLKLGRGLKALDVVCLAGNLGAGKTTFAEGMARGAGFTGAVMSPSFGLVRLYKAPKIKIYHIDLFRVSDLAVGEIGIEDCFGDPKGVVIIEWAGPGRFYLPPDRLEIILSYRDIGLRSPQKRAGAPLGMTLRSGRDISLKPLGPRSIELMRAPAL